MFSNTESAKKHIRREIGRNIQVLREKASLTRKELASIMGVTYQQIYKYETGENTIRAEEIVYLKFYLNADYNEFFVNLF